MQVQKEWYEGQTSTAELKGRKEFTVANVLYPVSFIIQSAVTSTAGLPRTIGRSIPQSGDAAPVWSIVAKSAVHLPFRNRNFIQQF